MTRRSPLHFGLAQKPKAWSTVWMGARPETIRARGSIARPRLAVREMLFTALFRLCLGGPMPSFDGTFLEAVC